MEALTLPNQPWWGSLRQSLTESLTLHEFWLHKNPSWPLLEVTSWLYYLGNNEELSLAAEPAGVLCPCFSTKGQLLRPTDACQPARNLISDPGVQLTCNTCMLRIVWFLSEVLLCLEGRKSSWEQRGREPGTFLSPLAFFLQNSELLRCMSTQRTVFAAPCLSCTSLYLRSVAEASFPGLCLFLASGGILCWTEI